MVKFINHHPSYLPQGAGIHFCRKSVWYPLNWGCVIEWRRDGLGLSNNAHFFIILFRFLRHVPVIYVDYPGPASLTQIYGTFNRAMLRLVPALRSFAQPLTDAMVEFYTLSQVRRIIKDISHFSPSFAVFYFIKQSHCGFITDISAYFMVMSKYFWRPCYSSLLTE